MSTIDYDDIVCPHCNHIGVLPDGGYDWVCPECGYEGTLGEDEENEDSYDPFIFEDDYDELDSLFDDDGFSSQSWDDEY